LIAVVPSAPTFSDSKCNNGAPSGSWFEIPTVKTGLYYQSWDELFGGAWVTRSSGKYYTIEGGGVEIFAYPKQGYITSGTQNWQHKFTPIAQCTSNTFLLTEVMEPATNPQLAIWDGLTGQVESCASQATSSPPCEIPVQANAVVTIVPSPKGSGSWHGGRCASFGSGTCTFTMSSEDTETFGP
jgi:hypothetical protein